MPNYYGSLDDYKKSVLVPKTQIVNPEPPSYDPKELREQMLKRIPEIKAAIKKLDTIGTYGERDNAKITLRSYERIIARLGKEISSTGGSVGAVRSSGNSSPTIGGGLKKGSK